MVENYSKRNTQPMKLAFAIKVLIIRKSVKDRHEKFWAGLVLFAAFMCQLITLGITQNFGIYVKKIKDYYVVDPWQTTLIGSIAYGCFCLIGIFYNLFNPMEC